MADSRIVRWERVTARPEDEKEVSPYLAGRAAIGDSARGGRDGGGRFRGRGQRNGFPRARKNSSGVPARKLRRDGGTVNRMSIPGLTRVGCDRGYKSCHAA